MLNHITHTGVPLGYVFAFLSLLIFPPGFGLAGLVCGIMNVTRDRIGHGFAQIILSVTCGCFGAIFGAIVMSR